MRTGRDRAHGISLRIRQPGAGPDALKLVASGRIDLGVLDIHDLAIARQQGVDLVGVAALVGRPLAALVARGDVRRPRDLEGAPSASPGCRRTRRSSPPSSATTAVTRRACAR